jgi:broad specificity phosphatase PhoE
MTQIILARHGNTPWNKDKIFRGSKDIPLDDLGREEAWAVAKWLKDETIHAAYTSPLSRARDTAIAIARHHDLEVLDLPCLADLSYGDWEGVPLKEVKVKYADLYHQWETAPHTVCFPNGETLAVLRTRALAAVEEVVQRHPDRTVLLMAHRAVNKVLIAAFIGLDNSNFWRIAQDTTAINRFHLVEDSRRVGKTWYIISINETGHLRGMMRGAYVDF